MSGFKFPVKYFADEKLLIKVLKKSIASQSNT